MGTCVSRIHTMNTRNPQLCCPQITCNGRPLEHYPLFPCFESLHGLSERGVCFHPCMHTHTRTHTLRGVVLSYLFNYVPKRRRPSRPPGVAHSPRRPCGRVICEGCFVPVPPCGAERHVSHCTLDAAPRCQHQYQCPPNDAAGVGGLTCTTAPSDHADWATLEGPCPGAGQDQRESMRG